MRGPGGIIAEPYDFQTYDDERDKTVSFRPVEMSDLGMLHSWLNEEHVLPDWSLNDPLPEFQNTLEAKLADDHMTPYVGHLDHVPMSYFEAYWAIDDVIADHYDADPADQGFHMLLGPPEYLGHGYAESLMRAMLQMQFRHPETDRVVGEPDVHNEKVHSILKKIGFEPRREIEMENKTALLLVCERERFEREVLG
ncbi:GNAT family N-acetyltransferase [Natrinema amylolyticum]|uniref:GNAT family N-acetyltransferase n=1 Tax=Natrinema amylolyticum TaxID=2878679 RepID=UPI001CFA0E78|nr:GNAT family N-acetyltransferase [Natrinema amylolyticum]